MAAVGPSGASSILEEIKSVEVLSIQSGTMITVGSVSKTRSKDFSYHEYGVFVVCFSSSF